MRVIFGSEKQRSLLRFVRIVSVSATVDIQRLAADEFERRYKAQLAVRERTLLCSLPASKLAVARAKTADGTASLTDRLLILAERTARQQWDDAFQQLAAIETSQAGQPGLPWLRIALEKVAGRQGKILNVKVDPAKWKVREKFVEFVAEKADTQDIASAEVIVSGGRGLGKAEGFKLIEDFARLLGGAVGASRAVVDAGWIPYRHQVG